MLLQGMQACHDNRQATKSLKISACLTCGSVTQISLNGLAVAANVQRPKSWMENAIMHPVACLED